MWGDFLTLLVSPAGVLVGVLWSIGVWGCAWLIVQPLLWLERRRLARMRANTSPHREQKDGAQ